MITVVNKYKHTPTESDVYIGRGSPLGNPYTSKQLSDTKAKFQAKDRDDSIQKYREHLYTEIELRNDEIWKGIREILNKLDKNGYVNLVCFCKPKPCHGDIIKEIIEEHKNYE